MPNETGVHGGSTLGTGDAIRARLLANVPVTERRVEVAGVTTAILEGGSGPPIVLLHGQGAWAGVWMPIIPPLVATHRVIAPDLPGLGASRLAGASPTAAKVMEWLDELIRVTCDAPPALVGISLGGSIAARFAAHHGHRIDRLVLVDTGGLSGPVRLPPPVLLALIRHSARPSERTAARFMRLISFDADRLQKQMGPGWEPFQAYMLDRARDGGVRAANRVLLRELGLPAIPPEDLERIKVPTSMIWGRHDRVMPLRGAAKAQERFGWPLHVIEEAGHIVPADQPGAFVDALRTALEK